MDYKAIVFDLDGTLLDTLKDLNEACNHSLKKYNYDTITLDETRNFIGNGIHNLIEKSLKGNLNDLESVYSEFKRYYKDNCNVYTKPYDGILDLIDYCKNKGIKLGVLSNKAQYALDILCDAHFPNKFDIVVGDRDGIERKPSISGLQYISNIFGIGLKDILYIGDSDVDVKTVDNAKCKGIFVSYGFRDKKRLIDSGAICICDSVYELVKKLEV